MNNMNDSDKQALLDALLKEIQAQGLDKFRAKDVDKYPHYSTGFYDDKQPNYDSFLNYSRDEYHPLTTEAGVYIYKDNYYQYVGKQSLKGLVFDITRGRVRPQHLNLFVNYFMAGTVKNIEAKRSTLGKINLANGILNIKTKELLEHSPEYFFQYKLPHKYDPKAQCPNFLSFLDFIFEGNGELIDDTQEIYGYCLAGGNQWLHKAFCLIGEGRNGKSTWLDILAELLGRPNVASVSLDYLNKPFSVVSLDGKLANIIEETPNDTINAELFKAATSGGVLRAAYKTKDEFDLKCNARFLFASNSYPRFKESTTGLNERLHFLYFNRYIKEGERNPNIKGLILEELPGILNFALAGLERLLERGQLLSTHTHALTAFHYRKETDSVFDWADENVSVNPEAGKFFTTRSLYEHYKGFCNDVGKKPFNETTFSKRLASYFKDTLSVREYNALRDIGDGLHGRKRGYKGISFKINTALYVI